MISVTLSDVFPVFGARQGGVSHPTAVVSVFRRGFREDVKRDAPSRFAQPTAALLVHTDRGWR